MKRYIDCDGVILNTEEHLLDEYYEIKKQNPDFSKREYITKLNWDRHLRESSVLNDAINLLNNHNPKDIFILTKVFSFEEGIAKVRYFREKHVKNNIILVPDGLSKSQVVLANGSILVDDSINNLSDWKQNKGIPIYFGEQSTDYIATSSLEEVLHPKKAKELVKRYKEMK